MATLKTNEAVCVGCGCTDLRACAGGCSWLAVNRDDGTGVCSNCGKSLTAWRHQQAQGAADTIQPREQQTFGGADFTAIAARLRRLRLIATRHLMTGR